MGAVGNPYGGTSWAPRSRRCTRLSGRPPWSTSPRRGSAFRDGCGTEPDGHGVYHCGWGQCRADAPGRGHPHRAPHAGPARPTPHRHRTVERHHPGRTTSRRGRGAGRRGTGRSYRRTSERAAHRPVGAARADTLATAIMEATNAALDAMRAAMTESLPTPPSLGQMTRTLNEISQTHCAPWTKPPKASTSPWPPSSASRSCIAGRGDVAAGSSSRRPVSVLSRVSSGPPP